MTKKTKKTSPGFIDKIKTKQATVARRTMLEELFNDFHKNRKQVFVLNFFRGIFFGLGSVLGGTVVVALIVWILGIFEIIPILGDTAQQVQDSISPSE